MSNAPELPARIEAVVPAGKRDIALHPGQVYISHKQAAAIYGESSVSPDSVLGALFELHFALLREHVKRGGGKGTDPQLDHDFSENAKFGLVLQAMISHAKEGGLQFYRPRSGVKRILGRERVPLGEATDVLPEMTQLHGRIDNGPFDKAWMMEIPRFMESLRGSLQMADTYLAPAQRDKLIGRIRQNMAAIGFSADVLALPETAETTEHRLRASARSAGDNPVIQR